MKTRMIDISHAFLQALLPVNEEVFVEVPPGFDNAHEGDVVLKLVRNLYGLRQAPAHYFQKFSDSLAKLGFVPSAYDQCLFFRHQDGMIIISHVDDCLLFHKDDKVIDKFIADFGKLLPCNDEKVERLSNENTSVYQYLGIDLKVIELDDGYRKVVMSQEPLIDRVLQATGMENCNSKRTPASATMLGLDKDGEPYQEQWEYASVVGMLMYLVNTRPDVQPATHQACRFTHAPKQSHAEAVKWICKYLKGTKDRGLEFLVGPVNSEVRLDCYVDSSFANLFSVEDPLDPVSSKSRTGYIFFLFGCALDWKSCLQQTSTISPNESEYIALSEAMRDLIPLRGMVTEIADCLKMKVGTSTVKSTVFADNTGAIGLAKAPNMKSRTRSLNQRYHFFRQHIGKDKGIDIEYVKSEDNVADHFSKCLGIMLFEKLRKLFMGW